MGAKPRVPDTVILQALVAYRYQVSAAAKSLEYPRSHYYERLAAMGIGAEQLRLARKGDVPFSCVPFRDVPKSSSVPLRQEEAGPILVDVSSATAEAATATTAPTPTLPLPAPRRPWKPFVKDDVQDMFHQAQVRLLRMGHETDKDNIFDAFVRACFKNYVDSLCPIESLMPGAPLEDKDK